VALDHSLTARAVETVLERLGQRSLVRLVVQAAWGCLQLLELALLFSMLAVVAGEVLLLGVLAVMAVERLVLLAVLAMLQRQTLVVVVVACMVQVLLPRLLAAAA